MVQHWHVNRIQRRYFSLGKLGEASQVKIPLSHRFYTGQVYSLSIPQQARVTMRGQVSFGGGPADTIE